MHVTCINRKMHSKEIYWNYKGLCDRHFLYYCLYFLIYSYSVTTYLDYVMFSFCTLKKSVNFNTLENACKSVDN